MEAALRNKVCEPRGIADRMSTYNQPQLANWTRESDKKKKIIDHVQGFG